MGELLNCMHWQVLVNRNEDFIIRQWLESVGCEKLLTLILTHYIASILTPSLEFV